MFGVSIYTLKIILVINISQSVIFMQENSITSRLIIIFIAMTLMKIVFYIPVPMNRNSTMRYNITLLCYVLCVMPH